MSESRRYWPAFLVHPANQVLVLGGTAAGVLASVPFGWDALGLVMLAIAAIEVVGLAVVTSLPPFRRAVDDQARRDARKARRERLLEEIDAHRGSSYIKMYHQMDVRVQSLYRMAADRSTTLTYREVEQLDDLVVGYLAMCLSEAVTDPKEAGETTALAQRKLRGVEQELKNQGLDAGQVQQLRRTKAEYEEVLARQARMVSRRGALEANLVSMPVRLEEVYQMVVAAPASGDLGGLLEESVAKLRAAEELTLDVESVFRLNSTSGRATGDEEAQRAARASQAVGGRNG